MLPLFYSYHQAHQRPSGETDLLDCIRPGCTLYWLGLLRDALDADKNEIGKLMKETSELAKLLASNLRSMSASKQV